MLPSMLRSTASLLGRRRLIVNNSSLPSTILLSQNLSFNQSPHNSHNFHSRAHPRTIPEVDIPDALNSILKEVDGRKVLRAARNHRRATLAPSSEDNSNTTTFQQPDEMIELAVNLNLDPKKPGQALRGSISLPHGTGKKQAGCIVFTEDPEIQNAALQAGATYAGGESLVDDVAAGRVPVDGSMKSLATADIMPILSKKIARLLGPRGLMPNAKVGTLVNDGPQLMEALNLQLAGKEVSFRTDRGGIVHVPVGKGSFGKEKLLENIGEVMKALFGAKPETYGKGKKKKTVGKGTKYLLRASLSSTQGRGYRLDPRTVDPNNVFFLTSTDVTADASSSTEANSEASTNDFTQKNTKPVTEVFTEAPTEAPLKPIAESSSKAPSEVPTQATTEIPAAAPSEIPERSR